jgi:NAD+ diphosphatase
MPSLSSAATPEPVLSGMVLDRASAERKDPGWLAARLADPASRVLAASDDAVLLDRDDATRLLRADQPVPARPDSAVLLAVEDGAALFAADLASLDPKARAALERRGRLVELRRAGPLLTRAEGGLAAYLVALLNWHRVHRFCANCGAATAIAEGGHSRHCDRCGRNHFPRTDPAVIMLVAHGDRVLLGRRPGWADGRWSVLAGFVSPGESLEEAVIREVREEAGIACFAPRFVASQPWPFPSSLMVGFEAGSHGGEPRTLDGELEDVRWFTREQVAAALAGEERVLKLPPGVSIARMLLERWASD